VIGLYSYCLGLQLCIANLMNKLERKSKSLITEYGRLAQFETHAAAATVMS